MFTRLFFSIATITIFAAPAYALKLSCGSKYFVNEAARVMLTANSGSEEKLTKLVLTIDGEIIRQVQKTLGQEYSGQSYKDMLLYSLDQSKNSKNRWSSSNLSLMLPQGWGEQGRFTGYIIEKSSDGGSYNKVFCSTLD